MQLVTSTRHILATAGAVLALAFPMVLLTAPPANAAWHIQFGRRYPAGTWYRNSYPSRRYYPNHSYSNRALVPTRPRPTAPVTQRQRWPNMPKAGSAGFASLQDVEAAVGSYSIAVACPHTDTLRSLQQRTATITIDRPAPLAKPVIATLLGLGLRRAWTACPMHEPTAIFQPTEMSPRVGFINIVGPDGDGDGVLYHARSYTMLGWYNVTDVAAERQQAEREAAARAAAARERAAQQAAERAAAERAAQQRAEIRAQRARRRAEALAQLEHTASVLGIILLVVAVVVVILRSRHALARWYYFYFHPHPAEPLVNSALATGSFLDGDALAKALGEVPPDSPILREVRLQQAENLMAKMKTAANAHLRKHAKEQKAKAKEEYESAALASAQEAIAMAATALERAKNLYSTGKEVSGG